MFRMKFDTGNAAFAERGEYEVVRILEGVANKIRYGAVKGDICDINGNPVGNWSLSYPKHITKGK